MWVLDPGVNRGIGLVAALAAIGMLGPALPSMAGFTDPVLALTEARAAAGTTQVVVRLLGSFHEQDLMQIAYPLQILVRETGGGDRFVRYDLSGGAFEGDRALPPGGLAPADAVEIATLGERAADARLLLLAAGRLELLLPRSFAAGSAEAQLFVLDSAGGPILSNPVTFVVPSLGDAP